MLHVLEVGEEEYALLRADQGIRVDYANFPGKLIGLLDKCIACQGEDLPRCGRWGDGVCRRSGCRRAGTAGQPWQPRPHPEPHQPAIRSPARRFQAVLHTGPAAPGSGGAPAPSCGGGGGGGAGAATFRVVENNDFKQLAHISLAFRAGSDAAVKQFLAFRLGELRTDCSQLSGELERTQASVGRGGGLGHRWRAQGLSARLEGHQSACCAQQAQLTSLLTHSPAMLRRASATACRRALGSASVLWQLHVRRTSGTCWSTRRSSSQARRPQQRRGHARWQSCAMQLPGATRSLWSVPEAPESQAEMLCRSPFAVGFGGMPA